MSPETDNWSEFDWEEAFREDDARVNMYLRELPKYIDLPGEDELVMRRIEDASGHAELRDPGLTDKLSRYFRKRPGDDGDECGGGDEGDDEFQDDAQWQSHDGAASFMLFSRLARLWAQEFALADGVPPAVFMRVSCVYGQLMLRGSDILDLPENDTRSRFLRISIAKRMLSGMNFLCGEFNTIRGAYPDFAGVCDYHFGQLVEMREKVIALIGKIRSRKADGV